jgi:AcrR family transcriptional regulator
MDGSGIRSSPWLSLCAERDNGLRGPIRSAKGANGGALREEAALQKSPLAQVKAPEKRKRRSQDELTSRMLEAAAGEFKANGYSGATTAAIARQAGVTEAQLFRYFGSKSNLFREAVFRPMDEQLLEFTNRHFAEHDETAGFHDDAAEYIAALQRFLSEHAEFLTSLVVAQVYGSKDAQGLGAVAGLARYFERNAKVMQGRLSAAPKVDPKLMVRVSFAAVLACVMFKDWIFPPGLASEEEIRAAISDFVLEGLGANADAGNEAEA